MHSASAEALHAAAWLIGAFQHEHLKPALGKQCPAFQSAQPATDNQDIVHLLLVLLDVIVELSKGLDVWKLCL